VRNYSVPVDVDDGSFVDAERDLKAIHDMAAEHLAHGEYAEALEVFEEIFRGQLERYGADHYRIGTALHNIGIVHLKSRNYIKAVELCRLAVQVRKQALHLEARDAATSTPLSVKVVGIGEVSFGNMRFTNDVRQDRKARDIA